jgi:CubicO group peptidase (beta-lactamase class C family)
VIANAHGGTLAEAVETYVTRPLAMGDTGFTVRDMKRLAVAYADGELEPLRMAEVQPVPLAGTDRVLVFHPDRILNPGSYQSGGGGAAGTARDFLKLLEALRTGGAPILKRETVAMASRNQIDDLPREDPGDIGWRFGFLSAVLADPERAAVPHSPGTLQWGGVYGHTWFIDPAAGLSAVVMSNTAIEGCLGRFPGEVRDAIYGV